MKTSNCLHCNRNINFVRNRWRHEDSGEVRCALEFHAYPGVTPWDVPDAGSL